jgi:septal ring factor EnvC (AmiA/AmiB activator)
MNSKNLSPELAELYRRQELNDQQLAKVLRNQDKLIRNQDRIEASLRETQRQLRDLIQRIGAHDNHDN